MILSNGHIWWCSLTVFSQSFICWSSWTMSGGVNLKTRSQSGSGIPLLRDIRGLSSALLGPAAQNQLPGGTSTSSSSASSVSSVLISKELLRGTGWRAQSSQRTHGTSGGTNRPPLAPRSAHSSPRVPRREMIPLKNSLRRGSLPQDEFRDLERHSNMNWRSGRHHFRSLDNEVVESSREQQALRKPSNGNVIWETSPAVRRDFQKQRMKMLARGDSNRGTIVSKSHVNGTNTGPAGRESPRMAALAPFRYRSDSDYLNVLLLACVGHILPVCACFISQHETFNLAVIWYIDLFL